METGIFRCGSCEARFMVVEPEIMEIGYILSSMPCKGHGTKTLSMAKFYAKEHGLIIRLHPWAQNGEHERLKKWYAKNGFWDTGEGWVFNPKVVH